jgi:hypothetical protein
MAAGLASLLLLTSGCFGLEDESSSSSTSTSAPAAPPDTSTVTTLPATGAWPAGVVWSDFVSETDAPQDLPPGAVATASGPNGTVAVGRSSASSGALGSVIDLSEAKIWASTDEGWQEMDTRLGNGTSALYDVAAWQGGYVAVGFHADAYERLATAVVLTSTDGRDWAVTTQLPAIWSAWGSRVRVTSSGAVLVEISMAVCSAASDFVNNPDPITVPALWSAVAPTGTYAQLATGALAALSPPTPTPIDDVGCYVDFGGTPEDQRRATFGTKLGDIAAIGDRFAVLNPDATTVSITTDLATWTPITLPEAVDQPLASLLYSDAGGRINVVTISPRPLGDGYVAGTVDPDAWVATVWVEDATGALQRISPWRPLYALGLRLPRLELRDGVIRLVGYAMTDAPGGSLLPQVATSQPAPIEGAPTCAPAPAANCNFVTLDAAQLSGADLTGIQMYGATITNANLAGAKLQNARLARANIAATSMAGADLTGADLTATRFTSTDLTSAVFAFTDVSAATFTGSNLAGATFAASAMDSTVVDASTTCPDGAPAAAADALVLATACRLR